MTELGQLSAARSLPPSAGGPDPFELQREISRRLASPALEGYEITKFIGEGTFGDVWQARDKKTGTLVAIKRLRKQPDQQSRAEVHMLAGLDAARGIVSLKSIHLDSEPYCFVMEYMSGGTLALVLQQRGKLPFREAWKLFRELADALAYVHRHGSVHCDLKPENVLLDTRGHPRLSDFGQARGQGPRGSSLGTRFYMPSEQARLDMPDSRWDVYAVGAICYQMLTGNKPRYSTQLADDVRTRSHSGSEVRDSLESYAEHLVQAPPPNEHRGLAGVTGEVAALVDRCLAADPNLRPKDAVDLLAQIDRCDAHRRRRPMLILGGVAPALTLLAAGLVVLFGGILALQDFQEKWAAQVVSDNQVIARSVASEIENRFNERARFVRQVAQDSDWITLLAARNDESSPQRAQEKLQRLYQSYSGQRVRRWSVADADGQLRLTYGRLSSGNVEADKPDHPLIVADRGWFNGVEDMPAVHATSLDAAGKFARQRLLTRRDNGPVVFFSEPFRRPSDDSMNEPWVISTSCVIPPEEASALAGVIAAELDYREFNESFARFDNEAFQRKVIVANERGQTFYHATVAHRVKQDDPSIVLPRIDLQRKDNAFFAEAFGLPATAGVATPGPITASGAVVARFDPWYDDDDTQYYISRSAAHLANGQKLAVFILHDKEIALAGFVEAERRARWLGVTLFGIGCLFLIGNVWVLRNTLRQEEAADG